MLSYVINETVYSKLPHTFIAPKLLKSRMDLKCNTVQPSQPSWQTLLDDTRDPS